MKVEKLFRNLRFVLSAFIVLLIFNSCGMSIPTIAYDDVYATNLKEHEAVLAKDSENVIYQDKAFVKEKRHYRELIAETNAEGEVERVISDTLEDGTQINYADYNEDDYYDYAYSARLRRFYHPFTYSDYYADYYTNLYWYTHDPLYWGTSIYLGYSWWYPSYYSRWYTPFYSPYYAWYWDPYYHHPHYHHHHHHHHHGHHHGHHHDICYFNSMDYNSNMYRGSSAGGSIKRAGNVTGGSIKKAITRNNAQLNKNTNLNRGSKPAVNNNGKINGATRKYNKPSNFSTSKSNISRNGKVSTINRQTNKHSRNYNTTPSRRNSSKSFNRSSSSSFNRSGGSYSSPSRSSSGGSRSSSSGGGSIRR